MFFSATTSPVCILNKDHDGNNKVHPRRHKNNTTAKDHIFQFAGLSMVFRGAPPTYTIGGVWPNPPDERGWQRASIHTDHGRLLIEYLKSGVVNIADSPTKIWKDHVRLRVVDPKTKSFARFVNKCKQAFIESTTSSAPTANMPIDTFEDDAFDSDDDDSRGNKNRPDPPNRMPQPRYSNTMDPLMHRVDYATRDQQISLPTRIFEGMPPLFSPHLSLSAILFHLQLLLPIKPIAKFCSSARLPHFR